MVPPNARPNSAQPDPPPDDAGEGRPARGSGHSPDPDAPSTPGELDPASAAGEPQPTPGEPDPASTSVEPGAEGRPGAGADASAKAGSGGRAASFDDEWAGIVAGLDDLAGLSEFPNLERDAPAGRSRPASGGGPDGDQGTGDGSGRSGGLGPGPGLSPAPEPTAPWTRPPGPRDWPTTPEVEALEEAESHFVPPEPPPIAGQDPLLTMAWSIVVIVPVALIILAVVLTPFPRIIGQVGGLALVGALAVLIWRMPRHRDDDDGPGAVV